MQSRCRKNAVTVIKRTICILFILLFYIYGFSDFLTNAQSSGDNNPSIRIAYFYLNACGSCNPEDEFYKKYNDLIGGADQDIEVKFKLFNTFKTYGSEEFDKFCDMYNVPEGKRSTPLLFIEDVYLEGEKEINQNLKKVFLEVKQEISNTLSSSQGDLDYDYRTVIDYFYIANCDECVEVESFLEKINKSYTVSKDNGSVFTRVVINKYNAAEPESLARIKELFKEYYIPHNDQKIPIVFIGDRYLSGAEAVKDELVRLIKEAKGLSPMDSGKDLPEYEGQPDLSGYELLGVFITGLVNGLNPCSISMLLFFLSLLVLKKTSILKMGLSFIAGKFITYLLLGTLFYNLFQKIDITRFNDVAKVVLLLVAAVLIVLNVQDFVWAKKERYGKIRLELPRGLRKLNHKWIKKINNIENNSILFLISFLLGIIISAGEFLCTGQIYLATIIYVLRSSPGLDFKAMIYFLIYGIAFVFPLMLVTIIIYKGREVFDLSEFFREKMHIVKLINALVFTIFALIVWLWF